MDHPTRRILRRRPGRAKPGSKHAYPGEPGSILSSVVNNSGTVVNHLTYSPFGKLTSESNATKTPFVAYTGQDLDEDLDDEDEDEDDEDDEDEDDDDWDDDEEEEEEEEEEAI